MSITSSTSIVQSAPEAIYLTDYQVPPYLISNTDLVFDLGEAYTDVTALLKVNKNPASDVHDAVLELVGANLELQSLAINGEELGQERYQVNGEVLRISDVPDQFELSVHTRIKPQENTSLEGLYLSKGMYCTQCEAEGFRKITYYLDRPDVMSRFTTKIIADKASYPILLSNGNPVGKGEEGSRHWVKWEDPFSKPCYLFALVAGDLSVLKDTFTTMTGRTIDLQIFVEPHDLDKCDHAMDSLKRSMRWDEDVYGREYDLDIYMIVAVSHFNMGAMENKGLNIFNTSCVLAKPETTTDAGFQRVEAVIAHEYFHNWSGNRVTCRDWFQLSLKEGFTVFRDQEFSADMGSRTVKRVEDVNMLKTVQFAEDAGPMAHPIRPDSYLEINNFYTVTVYEKGAEVVRMLHTLMGASEFRKGCDLYFNRHDGQAATCDDFVASMEDASKLDFSHFKEWYRQAGTPVVGVSGQYDEATSTYELTLTQRTPDTPGQTNKVPLQIPVAVGLLDELGNDLPLTLEGNENKPSSESLVLSLTEQEQVFRFVDVASQPVPSVLRGFSAPVKLEHSQSNDELAFLMSNDSDGFNRWSASQQLAVNVMQSMIERDAAGLSLESSEVLNRAYGQLLKDDSLDKAMITSMMSLPSEAYMAQISEQVDPGAIHRVRRSLRQDLGENLQSQLLAVYQAIPLESSYVFSAQAIAQRGLRNACLSYLMLLDDSAMESLCLEQYNQASNMTDQAAAFHAITHSESEHKQSVVDQFYGQWKDEALVIDQWFMVQASAPSVGGLARVEALMEHEAFEITNPNKVRALVGGFCNGNLVNFHNKDGSGYRYLADRIIQLNTLNPQIASRLCGMLSRWKKYHPDYANPMKTELERIFAAPLSPDVYEIVSKSLK
ncbi:MAG: aminopeptidase N [Moraxellaceae bacterium]|nr:MAG: aminopeptidase N [Moraxellaceae bacterium]